MDGISISNDEFRKTVLHMIYEKTHGSLSERIFRIEDIQSLFPQEQANQVFNAVDYLISEGFLSGKKSRYISGDVDIYAINITSEGINFCEGLNQMPKYSQNIQITGNSNSNIVLGDNNTQTIQNTEAQLDQLILLVEEMLSHIPGNQELIEILQLMQEQKTEGKPSLSFLKTIGRSIKNFALGTASAVLASFATAPILVALGL